MNWAISGCIATTSSLATNLFLWSLFFFEVCEQVEVPRAKTGECCDYDEHREYEEYGDKRRVTLCVFLIKEHFLFCICERFFAISSMQYLNHRYVVVFSPLHIEQSLYPFRNQLFHGQMLMLVLYLECQLLPTISYYGLFKFLCFAV